MWSYWNGRRRELGPVSTRGGSDVPFGDRAPRREGSSTTLPNVAEEDQHSVQSTMTTDPAVDVGDVDLLNLIL